MKNKNGQSLKRAAETDREPKTPITIALEGNWVDSNGGEIEITQDGNQVKAVGKNAMVLKFWTTGTGTLSGKTIVMTHKQENRVVDKVTGTVAEVDRINWNNRTHWKKTSGTDVEPNSIAIALEEGKWFDSNGSEIEITQDGNQVKAIGKNAKGWTTGTGTLSGKTIVMTHKQGNRVVSKVTGTVAEVDRIDWNNRTHWKTPTYTYTNTQLAKVAQRILTHNYIGHFMGRKLEAEEFNKAIAPLFGLPKQPDEDDELKSLYSLRMFGIEGAEKGTNKLFLVRRMTKPDRVDVVLFVPSKDRTIAFVTNDEGNLRRCLELSEDGKKIAELDVESDEVKKRFAAEVQHWCKWEEKTYRHSTLRPFRDTDR